MDSLIGDSISGDTPPSADAPSLDWRDITSFGGNPGNLGMLLGVPPTRTMSRPLVVALHGCGQTAKGFAIGSGFATLAARHDFLLCLPEQRAANNRQTCFSWFETGDTRRGSGEVESIREMVATAGAMQGADPKRVFITGLSAGGAMAGALLATYPELFAGGAIVAGLPYGAASGVSEAFEAMYSGKVKEPRIWGDAVRTASPNSGPWPRVTIWHGTGDTVVKPINAGELVKQWTNVHGLGAISPDEDTLGPATRRVWRDAAGDAGVTEYSLPRVGHGMAVAEATPPAPFFLPAGLSAAEQICRDFGLMREPKPRSILARLGLAR